MTSGRRTLARASAPLVRVTARPVAAVRRAGAAARPVLALVSPFGWAVLVATLACWAAGLALGWEELVVVAVVCTVALLGAVVFVLGRLRYEIGVDLADHRVVVGDRAFGRLLVTNAGARPALPATVELVVGRGVATFPVPRLAAGAAHEDVFRVPTSRRAVIPVGPVRSVRADPLGLLRREVVWDDAHQLVVHPRTVRLSGTSAGYIRDLEGRATSDLSQSDISFHALRDYVAGDDRRHVHWKSTARTGQLVVRQFEETRRSQLAVVLSTRADDFADAESFEMAVSVAGSLGRQALMESGALTLLTHAGTLAGTDRTRMLDDLSAVQTVATRLQLADVVRSAHASLRDASVVAFVVGSRPAPADLRAAAARLPADVRAIAVQCVPGETLARHTIADLVVLTLGTLDDLPRAMRRLND
ncbi:DUF58 domain-containing protein [Sediminihabitans luteus]|uniref:DUF58 domain-containing protein n=1 Tax=Sediminihabitans luteus TaxID=1138585 RepID=UPI001FD044E5|nr:DUF58 domain-containing protein [Sediminihabitans luteus]